MGTMPLARKAVPDPVVRMQRREAAIRLRSLADAMVNGHISRRNHEIVRVEAILSALSDISSGSAATDVAGTVYRTASRLLTVALAHSDPERCRQAATLLAEWRSESAGHGATGTISRG